jgi:type I restriction enzyme S subunit
MIIIAQGWAQCNLSKKDIDNYEVNIPTSREEQIRIATILSDMDNEIQELEQKKAKYEQIKQWAMQQLLTGKIRLK